ncbi:hypothetical protein [Paenibacillus tundrae]|nr:hypothetical protein [Paenibacillus tundrae]
MKICDLGMLYHIPEGQTLRMLRVKSVETQKATFDFSSAALIL